MAHSAKPVPDPFIVLAENQQLRGALAQAHDDLQAAEAKANLLEQQLQQFLYAASHDLQEPLRGIITHTQLLEQKLAAHPELYKDCTSVVLESAGRMRELLQQLLVYSRAGSSKQHRVVDLNIPFQMATLALAPQIKASGAHIARPSLPEAIGDERELAQVFQSILSNSLRFRSGQPPEIVVIAQQGAGDCTVTIQDNGCGIEPRFCQQVLLPFKRLQAAKSCGLGLAICEKILRAHHGRIWVESDGVHGTTVRFTLPC